MILKCRRRAILVAGAFVVLVLPGLVLAAGPVEREVTSVVQDVRLGGSPAHGGADSSAPVGDAVVAGHTTYAVLTLDGNAREAPRQVNLVGLVSCSRGVGNLRIPIPAQVDGLLFGCSSELRTWALPGDQTRPEDVEALEPTGWTTTVRTPAGALTRTVEYTYPAWAPADGEDTYVQVEGILWETTTFRPETDPRTGDAYNFQFGLNADALAARNVNDLDVVVHT